MAHGGSLAEGRGAVSTGRLRSGWRSGCEGGAAGGRSLVGRDLGWGARAFTKSCISQAECQSSLALRHHANFASPVCVRAACNVWLSGSGDSGVELEARGIFLRRAPGSASEMGPQWVWAASSWQVGWLELELAVLRQLWVPFQPAIHTRAPHIYKTSWRQDHFRAMVTIRSANLLDKRGADDNIF